MPTRFYNTLQHELADFVPLEKGPNLANPLAGAMVRMYTCGPTVYDFAHIGNFRAFLFADVLRRYLEFRGATVRQVMNMTDVGHMSDDTHADAGGEDKMAIAQRKLRENKKQGKIEAGGVENPDDPFQVADYFVRAFLDDAQALGLAVVAQRNASAPADQEKIMPRPTHWIPQFIKMIERLIAAGHAYVGADGVVYYDVHSFPEYGRLSGNSLEQLSHGAGGRTAERVAKKNPADFFLWKPDKTHLMRWPSPWGEGYPGWHIECSAMATSILGPHLDIHTGGEDNIFPHHECEIAQSQGATGQTFSQFWMHTRHLMVDGAKMSKSKGNFFTIRDLVAQGFDPLAIRYSLINTRYREAMNFSITGLHEAALAVGTLRDLAKKLLAAAPAAPGQVTILVVEQKMLDDFAKSMDDDLNMAGALAAVFSWASPLHKQKKLPPEQAASALAALRKIDHVLGVILPPLRSLPPAKVTEIESLMAQRNQARAAKDFAQSDTLRKQLLALGAEVKDTAAGSIWRPRLAPVAG